MHIDEDIDIMFTSSKDITYAFNLNTLSLDFDIINSLLLDFTILSECKFLVINYFNYLSIFQYFLKDEKLNYILFKSIFVPYGLTSKNSFFNMFQLTYEIDFNYPEGYTDPIQIIQKISFVK